MARRRRKAFKADYWTHASDGHDEKLQYTLIGEIRSFKEKRGCVACGGDFPYYVLDFDHVHGQKLFNISQALRFVWPQKVAAIWREIDKCEVVCANCHRIRTHQRLEALRQAA